MKVFISSVISGMEEFRDVAARAARSLGHEVIRAEDFGASIDSAQTTCLAGVREAEAVILLMGRQYGAIQSSGLSASHEEYNEARERCPLLVMVQDGVERDDKQTVFVAEVQDWAQGRYTAPFSGPDQLLDALVGALHNYELSVATGPVDPDEMLHRAIELIPTNDRHGGNYGGTRLALALTGGPLQSVLRPAELEAQELTDRLHQIALFGEAAILSTHDGTEPNLIGDTLTLQQQHRSVSISENGSIMVVTEIPQPDHGMSVIIEEEVCEVIDRFLKFADAVLQHIDPVNRLSHCVIAAAILDAGHMAWRTRAEHAQSPNSVTMNVYAHGDVEPVHLSPPHHTRSALRVNRPQLTEDLTVKLRRQLKDAGRP